MFERDVKQIGIKVTKRNSGPVGMQNVRQAADPRVGPSRWTEV